MRAQTPAAQILDLDEGGSAVDAWRRKLWILLELPTSSWGAKALEIASVALILLSLITLVAASHESFRVLPAPCSL